MSKHYNLLETTCRAIAGRNWMRTASRALGVSQADLRSTFDRDDLPDEMINRLHAQLKRAAIKYYDAVKLRALRIHDAAMAVQIAQNERIVELLRAEDDRAASDPELPMNRMTAAFLADLLEEEDA